MKSLELLQSAFSFSYPDSWWGRGLFLCPFLRLIKPMASLGYWDNLVKCQRGLWESPKGLRRYRLAHRDLWGTLPYSSGSRPSIFFLRSVKSCTCCFFVGSKRAEPIDSSKRACSETQGVRIGDGRAPRHHLVLGFPNWVSIRNPCSLWKNKRDS